MFIGIRPPGGSTFPQPGHEQPPMTAKASGLAHGNFAIRRFLLANGTRGRPRPLSGAIFISPALPVVTDYIVVNPSEP